jgi:hypothetical protein
VRSQGHDLKFIACGVYREQQAVRRERFAMIHWPSLWMRRWFAALMRAQVWEPTEIMRKLRECVHLDSRQKYALWSDCFGLVRVVFRARRIGLYSVQTE